MVSSSMTARTTLGDDMRSWGERRDCSIAPLQKGDGGAAGEVLQYIPDPVIAKLATLLSSFYRSTLGDVVLLTAGARTIICADGAIPARARLGPLLPSRRTHLMTWIRTTPPSGSDEAVARSRAMQRALYPMMYGEPGPAELEGESIVASHSLIPDAQYHAFSTFGVLMSPDLPLERRHHEMIATMVSVTNRCRY
jgi:hypothetical protein